MNKIQHNSTEWGSDSASVARTKHLQPVKHSQGWAEHANRLISERITDRVVGFSVVLEAVSDDQHGEPDSWYSKRRVYYMLGLMETENGIETEGDEYLGFLITRWALGDLDTRIDHRAMDMEQLGTCLEQLGTIRGTQAGAAYVRAAIGAFADESEYSAESVEYMSGVQELQDVPDAFVKSVHNTESCEQVSEVHGERLKLMETRNYRTDSPPLKTHKKDFTKSSRNANSTLCTLSFTDGKTLGPSSDAIEAEAAPCTPGNLAEIRARGRKRRTALLAKDDVRVRRDPETPQQRAIRLDAARQRAQTRKLQRKQARRPMETPGATDHSVSGEEPIARTTPGSATDGGSE